MKRFDEAIKVLNKYRNFYHNSNDTEQKEISQALDCVLPTAKKLETLLELYRDYFFVVEQKYNITNSENNKTELAVRIKELESEIEK